MAVVVAIVVVVVVVEAVVVAEVVVSGVCVVEGPERKSNRMRPSNTSHFTAAKVVEMFIHFYTTAN